MGIAPASENAALLSAINFQVAKEGEKKLDGKAAAGGGARTSKAQVTQETYSYDWSDQVKELELTLSHAFMAEKVFKYGSHNEDLIKEVTKLKYFNSEFLKNEELFKKKLDAERRDISQLKELLSDKESNYRDARRHIDELTSELEHLKTQLSKTKIHAEKYEYASTLVASMVYFQCRKREKIGIVFTVLLKSDRRYDFATGSSKPVPLTANPVETDLNISDDSEACADSLNDTGLRGKNEERSVGRSIDCSTSFRTSSFIPKTDFVGRYYEIKIKPNEIFKNFNSTFGKNDVILETISSSLHQVNRALFTITKKAGSKLNPNCEPFVPTRSLEQVSTSTSSGHADCDVKSFDPKEFHEK
ncbi:hypothetical protein R6Q57_021361, partial [Mikania cordata]